ncbi:MAG: PotD/PotF family extracellular solute-binding protein [Candidatus Weimeria sp.]
MKKRIKKLLAVMLAGVMTVSIMTGCGSSSASGDSASGSASSDELNIIIWDGTWSEDMFKDFTKETGIKVNISYISNTDELLTKLINGSVTYDVMDLENAYVQTFIKNGLLAEIDDDNIPNESNIIDDYMKEGPVGDEDFKYTVPDMAPNYTTVIYNKETCPVEIKSLKDLANPKLKGRVALVDSTISLYGAALQCLGYKADSTNENEIKEANDLLMKIKENTKAFVGETAVPQLEDGEVDAALCWDYPTLCGDSEDNWDKFGYVSLDGGVERFSQYWAISSSSTNKANAEKLINFILEPEEYAKSLTEYPLSPLEKKDLIQDYLPDGYYDSPAMSKLNEDLFDNSWEATVSEDQIDIMDTYYTQLKGE